MTTPLAVPGFLQRKVEAEYQRLLQPEGGPDIDFSGPTGAPALAAPDSISWQVFKNPLTLFIGGVTAVILELGEARVRAGVWDHTSFRTDPLTRLRRTGLAAMVTVYGAREVAETMIAGVNRAHERVQGTADDGRAYRANDVELLDWVQATASLALSRPTTSSPASWMTMTTTASLKKPCLRPACMARRTARTAAPSGRPWWRR